MALARGGSAKKGLSPIVPVFLLTHWVAYQNSQSEWVDLQAATRADQVPLVAKSKATDAHWLWALCVRDFNVEIPTHRQNVGIVNFCKTTDKLNLYIFYL